MHDIPKYPLFPKILPLMKDAVRHFARCLCLALLLPAILSCGGKGEQAEAGKAAPERKAGDSIHVAYLPTLDALPFFVAQEHGWLGQQGLKVSLVPFMAQMDVDTALVGGSVDGAFTDIIRAERLQQRDSVKLDYLTLTEAQWTLVSNRAARLNKLEQFGDKMVAMTRYSATDLLTDSVFKGVKTSNLVFKVQINDLEVRKKMLLSNMMDAAWLPEPLATETVRAGHRALVKPQKKSPRFGVVAFNSAFMKSKGGAEDYEKLAKVYSSACDSLNKNGLEAYAKDIRKWCRVDTAVTNHLPKMTFTRVSKPSEELVEKARSFVPFSY